MRTILAFLLLAAPVLAGDELENCRRLAPKYGAETEAVQWDGTRVDLLSDEYAIEVDWCNKWPEAVGQCQWYSIVTGRHPGVVLLIKDKKAEAQHIYRATAVCDRLGIRLWLEDAK